MIFNIICAVLTIASFVVTFYAVDKWQKAERKYNALWEALFEKGEENISLRIEPINYDISYFAGERGRRK